MDQGIHTMKYKLVMHNGDWRRSGIVQKALSLNNPAQKVHETYHDGPLPLKAQNIFISNSQVVLTVMKPSEDGTGTVLRLYETHGSPAKTEIRIPLLNLDTQLSFGAFEIKSLHIDECGDATEINMIEMKL
jgi:alpha-mannosidase